MKNLVVARMKIRNINFNNVRSRVYIYENSEDALYLIAIPELNWSLEVDITLNEDDLKEEIVIHLFTLIDESLANTIAEDIIERIFEN